MKDNEYYCGYRINDEWDYYDQMEAEEYAEKQRLQEIQKAEDWCKNILDGAIKWGMTTQRGPEADITRCFFKEDDSCRPEERLKRILAHKDSKGNLKPEVVSDLIQLYNIGYVKSFRWMGDCYQKGIGCEQNTVMASKCYYEGMVFDFDPYCAQCYSKLNPGVQWYYGEDLEKQLISQIITGTGADEARVRIAELILDGEIDGYDDEVAYTLLQQTDTADGMAEYRLACCLFQGRGTPRDPIAVRELLPIAQEKIKWRLEWRPDQEWDWYRDSIIWAHHEHIDFDVILQDIDYMAKECKNELDKIRRPLQEELSALGRENQNDNQEWNDLVPLLLKRK